jgi:hypothetical protein
MWRRAAVLMVVMALSAGGCADRAPAVRQHVAIPAYWSPDLNTGAVMFDRLARAAPAVRIVVVNGANNGPQVPFDQAWARTFRVLKDAGVRPLGYVDTGYLGAQLAGAGPAHTTRPDGVGRGQSSVAAWRAQIVRDVEDWFRLYGPDGIFLDQTTAVCGPDGAYVRAYTELVAQIRKLATDTLVVLNPGRSVAECYKDVGDTLVTFEGTYSQYLNRTAPSWEREGAASRFWHLVYDVPDQRGMTKVIALSKERNAGYIYVTDDQLSPDGQEHPWDTIPPDGYWRSELTAAYGPGLVLPSDV